METIISVTITGSSDMHYLDLYLINIFTKYRKAERCTDVMFKLTFYCLSVTVEDLNLQQRYKYFRYTIFRFPRCYFRYTIGARHERAPNFSCPANFPFFFLKTPLYCLPSPPLFHI